ncbi:hypothetical protein DPMN_095125 [Dreissena polymorpha]|uniref:Uncharacterized protein n=1 Tax=Dreissena polymorpha TaxID=45954 RepID=A0A9D4L8R3_DREPO|nr:hypothetical protein DPMN_095125 [Dreissena polymorpha]
MLTLNMSINLSLTKKIKTQQKTFADINKFRRYLAQQGETKQIHEIPVDQLDHYVARFILSLTKPEWSDYEPSSAF